MLVSRFDIELFVAGSQALVAVKVQQGFVLLFFQFT